MRVLRLPLADVYVNGDLRHDTAVDPALVAALRETGQLQPIVVVADGTGRYQIVAGRRRYRAARELGWELIDAVLYPRDEESRFLAMVEENAVRRNWSPLEIAEIVERLRREFHWTQEQVAEWFTARGLQLGQAQVAQYAALNRMGEQARALVERFGLGFSHARALSRLNGQPELQRALVAEIEPTLAAGDEISVRTLTRMADRYLTPAPEHAERHTETQARTVARVYAATPALTTTEPPAVTAAPIPVDPAETLTALYAQQLIEAIAYLSTTTIAHPLITAARAAAAAWVNDDSIPAQQ